jgi:hypothetical protein
MSNEENASSRFRELLDRARSDPEFFHRLAFEPARLAEDTDDPVVRAAIQGVNVNSVFGQLARGLGVQWCGETCGSASCINTCGARSCDATCADSCGTTCSHSCGETTKVLALGQIFPAGGPFIR